MAALNLLAVGNTAAISQDFTVAQGESATICLKGSDATGEAQIFLKDDAGAYVSLGKSLTANSPAICITAPGIYRVVRPAGKTCGVFRA